MVLCGQGHNSQGTLCPRDATSKDFWSGNIGRGRTNIAPIQVLLARQEFAGALDLIATSQDIIKVGRSHSFFFP